MFRFLALVGVAGCAVATCASQYCVVDLGIVRNVSTPDPGVAVSGIGSDGSIAYSQYGNSSRSGIYSGGVYRTMKEITGFSFFDFVRIKDEQHFCMPEGPAYYQWGDEYVWEDGTSQLLFPSGAGMSAKRQEWTWFREENPTLELSGCESYVRRAGLESRILTDPFAARADFSLDMNEDGWILGGSGSSPRDINYKSWLLAPDTLTPALIPSNLLFKAYRVGDDGYVYGTDTSGISRFKIGTSVAEKIRDQDGRPWSATESRDFDMNRHGTVAVFGTKLASGNLPQRKALYVYENGVSKYLEDSLVNPEVLPLGESMRGVGINDAGQIATIMAKDGKAHLFRFDPVPEPATFLALGAGLATIARRRFRRP